MAVTWTATVYIYLNLDGGSGISSVYPYTYPSALAAGVTSTQVTFSTSGIGTPKKTGFNFKGWTGSTTATVRRDTVEDSKGSGNATLTAKWDIQTYKITYNANGGSGAPSNQTKTYGKALTLSSTIPTRTGYTFSKWNTAADGSGTNYSAGASYTTNKAVTLYAVWTPNKYIITFNNGSNRATGANFTKSWDYGSTYSLINIGESGFSRANYQFAGTWRTSSTGTDAITSLKVTGNKTLYANWTPTVQKLSNPSVSLSRTSGLDPFTKVTIKFNNLPSSNLGSVKISISGLSTVLTFTPQQAHAGITFWLDQFMKTGYNSSKVLTITYVNTIPGQDNEFNSSTNVTIIPSAKFNAPDVYAYTDSACTIEKVSTDTRVASTGQTLWFKLPSRVTNEKLYYSTSSGSFEIPSSTTKISLLINSTTPSVNFYKGGVGYGS